jgi:hypothetical protein
MRPKERRAAVVVVYKYDDTTVEVFPTRCDDVRWAHVRAEMIQGSEIVQNVAIDRQIITIFLIRISSDIAHAIE